ncbi:sedoheptulose 7-phosphate cyclase [Comamonas flocculans]|uniref:Sedoheptulose 7-phosphate cyclase n=1 Tax=Comamonas flocculans TaxID=2597701 RepID=A0A5B8RPU2_9BURK|nr:sedoheptulose 7-phosphate cyclase [Comamonas flocculans]QEA11691.1 sedoheptulose 7-phosphate cyclase [Comamonas flocculans]
MSPASPHHTTLWQVRSQRPIAYDVVKTPGLFAPGNTTLLGYGRPGGRRFVVLDARVWQLHGSQIRAWFAAHGIEAHYAIFPGGEEHKNIDALQDLARALDAFPVHRRDEPLIAIGGGVLTDVAAYLAASYRRGIPHVKLPTTLMGYIDAALGIKNGINFGTSKNRLGSFEPPLAVLLEPAFLRTLPRRHLANGLCEIIKLAIVTDATLFTQLETHGARSLRLAFATPEGDALLDRAITGMLAELAPNLHEEELSRKVDFGHTFSYGLETRHPQRLLHGEAVLLDCLLCSLIAAHRGLLPDAALQRILALVRQLAIAPKPDVLEVELMWQALQDRVQHRNGLQRVPLPTAIGQCTFAHDITRAEIARASAELQERLLHDDEPTLQR